MPVEECSESALLALQQRAWKLYIHEDTLAHQRHVVFLSVQTSLFASLVLAQGAVAGIFLRGGNPWAMRGMPVLGLLVASIGSVLRIV